MEEAPIVHGAHAVSESGVLQIRKYEGDDDYTRQQVKMRRMKAALPQAANVEVVSSAPAEATIVQLLQGVSPRGAGELGSEQATPALVQEAQTESTLSTEPLVDSNTYALVMQMNEAITQQEAWLWCAFLGMFGAHYFYLNRPKRGLLYTVTLGFLFLGYLHDLITMSCLVARVRIKNATSRLELPYYDEAYLTEAYFFAVPLGWLGAHHFYMQQYWKGLLYMCTFGLLGVGWIFDLFFMPKLVRDVNAARKKRFEEKHGQELFAQTNAYNVKYKPTGCCQ